MSTTSSCRRRRWSPRASPVKVKLAGSAVGLGLLLDDDLAALGVGERAGDVLVGLPTLIVAVRVAECSTVELPSSHVEAGQRPNRPSAASVTRVRAGDEPGRRSWCRQRVVVVAVVLEAEVGQAARRRWSCSRSSSRCPGCASLTIVTLPQLLRSIGNVPGRVLELRARRVAAGPAADVAAARSRGSRSRCRAPTRSMDASAKSKAGNGVAEARGRERRRSSSPTADGVDRRLRQLTWSKSTVWPLGEVLRRW